MLRFRIKCSIFMDTEKCRKHNFSIGLLPIPLGLYPGPLGDLYATQPFWFICFHVNPLLQKPCNSNTLKPILSYVPGNESWKNRHL